MAATSLGEITQPFRQEIQMVLDHSDKQLCFYYN